MTGHAATVSGGGGIWQRVLLHPLDQAPNGIAQRAHQYHDGHDEHRNTEQHQQGRREPRPSAEAGSDAQVQGVEGHRKDNGPDRERHERSQDAIAEHRHGQEKCGPDQNVEQPAGEATFDVRVGYEGRCHDGSCVPRFCRFGSRLACVRRNRVSYSHCGGQADLRGMAADGVGL